MLGFAPLSTLPLGATPAPPGPYVRPAAASADISFDGATYTSPAYNAANLTFVPVLANYVTSTQSVATFGVPIAAYARTATATGLEPATNVPTPGHCLTQPTSGISTTSFGVGFGANYQRPVGFSTTEIGAARIFPYIPPPWNKSTQIGAPRLFPFHVAPWPVSTQFGGVGGNQFWRAPTMAVVARLGTPTTPTNRAEGATGFAPARFGRPLATRRMPGGVGVICAPSGFAATGLGSPSVRRTQYGAAQPIAPAVHVGTPAGSTAHHAAGIVPAQTGTPVVRLVQRAAAVNHTTTGAPREILMQRASSVSPKVRFGTHKTIRPNCYEVRGFCPFRAGTPRGYQRNNYATSGFAAAQFGLAGAREMHRVSPLPPVTRPGVPLLRRNTQC